MSRYYDYDSRRARERAERDALWGMFPDSRMEREARDERWGNPGPGTAYMERFEEARREEERRQEEREAEERRERAIERQRRAEREAEEARWLEEQAQSEDEGEE